MGRSYRRPALSAAASAIVSGPTGRLPGCYPGARRTSSALTQSICVPDHTNTASRVHALATPVISVVRPSAHFKVATTAGRPSIGGTVGNLVILPGRMTLTGWSSGVIVAPHGSLPRYGTTAQRLRAIASPCSLLAGPTWISDSGSSRAAVAVWAKVRPVRATAVARCNAARRLATLRAFQALVRVT